MTTMIFNAWATMRHLVRKPTSKHSPPNMDAGEDEPSAKIMAMYRDDPSAVQTALRTISENLGHFAQRCLDAGADGVFMSVRDDWLEQSQTRANLYDELVTPCDLLILEAVSSGRLNMLHVCGKAVRFRRFAEYPVQVINWADRIAGPSIADVRDWLKPAICAGVNNLQTLPHGSPDDCEAEVREAISAAGPCPIIIAPGCTYDPELVPNVNLRSVSRAVRVCDGPFSDEIHGSADV